MTRVALRSAPICPGRIKLECIQDKYLTTGRALFNIELRAIDPQQPSGANGLFSTVVQDTFVRVLGFGHRFAITTALPTDIGVAVRLTTMASKRRNRFHMTTYSTTFLL